MSSPVLAVSDRPYIPAEPLLRVSQKPRRHLEIFNEPVLLTLTCGDETGHWAGWVRGPASCVARRAPWLLRMIKERADGA